MRLEFAGAPEITASREEVWRRLTDPQFVAASAPGVESVEPIDSTHFKVISGIGAGPLRVRFELDVALSDVVPLEGLKMTSLGRAPGSVVDTVSTVHDALPIWRPAPSAARLRVWANGSWRSRPGD